MKVKHLLHFVCLSIAVLTLSLTTSGYGTLSQVYAVQLPTIGDNPTASQANGWQVVSSPTTIDLLGIDILSATDAWAVGGEIAGGDLYRVILHYTGGGWQTVEDEDGFLLYDVSMSSPNNGWAAGYMVYSHYANGTWTHDTDHWQEWYFGVEMVSDTNGWMVGGEIVDSDYMGAILEFKNGFWQSSDCPVHQAPSDVSMVDANEGWIVGEEGTILQYDVTDWVAFSSPTTEHLSSVTVVSPTAEAWAVGMNGTILHYTSGAWQSASSPVTNTLNSVAMVSADEGWAVGEDGTMLYYAGGSWQAINSPTAEDLEDVDVLPSGEGWVVGANGIILYHMPSPTPTPTHTPTPTDTPTPSCTPTDTRTPTVTPTAMPCPDTYEPDDEQLQARSIVVGEPAQAHNSHPAGDVDFVKFAALAGETYTMRTSNLGGRPDNDTTLTLYDVDGTMQLAYNDEHPLEEPGASRIVWEAMDMGTYFLKAAQFNPDVGGCELTYLLEVMRGMPTPTGTPTPTSTPVVTPAYRVYLPLVLKGFGP